MLDGFVSEINTYVDLVFDGMQDDVGRCAPLSNVYKSVLVAGCNRVVDPFVRNDNIFNLFKLTFRVNIMWVLIALEMETFFFWSATTVSSAQNCNHNPITFSRCSVLKLNNWKFQLISEWILVGRCMVYAAFPANDNYCREAVDIVSKIRSVSWPTGWIVSFILLLYQKTKKRKIVSICLDIECDRCDSMVTI